MVMDWQEVCFLDIFKERLWSGNGAAAADGG